MNYKLIGWDIIPKLQKACDCPFKEVKPLIRGQADGYITGRHKL